MAGRLVASNAGAVLRLTTVQILEKGGRYRSATTPLEMMLRQSEGMKPVMAVKLDIWLLILQNHRNAVVPVDSGVEFEVIILSMHM
jgi:hypothetical protein